MGRSNRQRLLRVPPLPKSRRNRLGDVGRSAAGAGGGRSPAGGRYSMTMQQGRCWEKYLKSSGVAPGQLVSSSSSSSCSCTSPDRPVVVSKGQPARGQCHRHRPGHPPEGARGFGGIPGLQEPHSAGAGGGCWGSPRAGPIPLPVPGLSIPSPASPVSCSGLTGEGQEAQAAHAQEVLQAEILHLEEKREWDRDGGRQRCQKRGAASTAPGDELGQGGGMG